MTYNVRILVLLTTSGCCPCAVSQSLLQPVQWQQAARAGERNCCLGYSVVILHYVPVHLQGELHVPVQGVLVAPGLHVNTALVNNTPRH